MAMKLGERVLRTLPAAMLLAFSLGFCSTAGAAQEFFTEDFSAYLYRDPMNTTAEWNTSAGLIRLWPFELARAGQCYLSGNDARAVTVAGEFAYVAASAAGLKIVNISSPTSPTLKSTCDTPGLAYDVAISRNYVFVADGTSGLQAIDVSDVSFPYVAGTCNTPGTARAVAISGDYAFVADDDSLQVIDIWNPTNPLYFKCIGSAPIASSGNAYDVSVAGDLAYVAAYDGGLQVFDVSDPTNPTPYATYTTAGNAGGVVVAGDVAYVAVAAAGVEIVDVTGPTPSQRGLCDVPGIAVGLAVTGTWVYVAGGTAGVQVVDASDLASPVWVDSCTTPQVNGDVAVEGGYVFAAASTAGLEVVKVAELTPPLLVKDFPVPGLGTDIVISGENAFVAANGGGLRIFNVTYPDNPVQQGSFTQAHANGLAVDGNYAYVTDSDNSCLWVMDVTDVGLPDSLAKLVFPGDSPKAVAVSGDYAFVAAAGAGILIVDVSDPSNPSHIDTYDTPGSAEGITISGDFAFVADGASGLLILDVSSAGNVSSAGSADTPGYAFDVAVSGDYAYVADGGSGLQVMDTDSLFMGPRIVGAYNTPGTARKLNVSGDYVFIADETSLQIVNVYNPSTPYLAGSHGVPGGSMAICPCGDFEFLTFFADAAGGIRVIQVFQRDYNTVDNQVQSTVVLTPPDSILAVRVFSAQEDSVYWYVSATAGELWDPIPRDGEWHTLSHPGTELVWRSKHYYRRYGANPGCAFVEIQLKYDYAAIDSVKDVAEDQGGYLRIRFNSSGLDYGGSPAGMPPGAYGVNQTSSATSYYVHRRIDDIGFSDEVRDKGSWIEEGGSVFATLGGATVELPVSLGDARALVYESRYFYSFPPMAVQSLPDGLWEVVGAVPAMQQPVYYCLVPSACDSMSTYRYTVYCVTTHTTDPEVFYCSPPDSGYSVDNLPPAAPLSPRGEYEYPPPVLYLTWDGSPERDFSHYTVYKGDNPYFVPSVTNRMGAPWENSFVDEEFDPDADSYYKISAWDIHENEGAFSLVGPENMTHVENPPPVPTVTQLEQNAPNPFNPVTVIRFSVARPGLVSLRIYDVQGRCVRTLVDDLKSVDCYEVAWDGRDDSGSTVPSGVYVYKLAAPYHAEARKMVLAR